jgi:hypothetical protein
MPTANPRVNVTLSPSLFDLVGHMARAQRVSRSQVLRELLEAAEPALQRVVALSQAAERAKGAVKADFAESLRRSQEVIEAELSRGLGGMDGLTGDLVAMAQRIEGRRPGRPRASGGGVGGGPASTPVPVTRGSGTGKTRTSGTKKGGGRGAV